MKMIIVFLLVAAPTVAMGQAVVFTESPSKKEVTLRAYAGPARAPEQVAIVYFGGRAICSESKERRCGSDQGLVLTQIDDHNDIGGKKWDGTLREDCSEKEHGFIHCKHPINSIQLEPGCHQLSFDSSLVWEVSRQTARDPHLFGENMMFEAGKKYRAELHANIGLWSAPYWGPQVQKVHGTANLWLEFGEIKESTDSVSGAANKVQNGALPSCKTPAKPVDEITHAARSGDLPKVQALLKNDPSLVNAKDSTGSTPLGVAAAHHHKDVVELLLANHADVNAQDSSGWMPLGFVLSNENDKDIAELLLVNHADVNARRNGGETLLHNAAFWGRKDALLFLLANGADVSARDNKGGTPLHQAAQEGRKEAAELLLANHADINAKDNDGFTPLHLAVEYNRKDVTELLLGAGADANAKTAHGYTPLHYALQDASHKEVAELLRRHGGHK